MGYVALFLSKVKPWVSLLSQVWTMSLGGEATVSSYLESNKILSNLGYITDIFIPHLGEIKTPQLEDDTPPYFFRYFNNENWCIITFDRNHTSIFIVKVKYRPIYIALFHEPLYKDTDLNLLAEGSSKVAVDGFVPAILRWQTGLHPQGHMYGLSL